MTGRFAVASPPEVQTLTVRQSSVSGERSGAPEKFSSSGRVGGRKPACGARPVNAVQSRTPAHGAGAPGRQEPVRHPPSKRHTGIVLNARTSSSTRVPSTLPDTVSTMLFTSAPLFPDRHRWRFGRDGWQVNPARDPTRAVRRNATSPLGSVTFRRHRTRSAARHENTRKNRRDSVSCRTRPAVESETDDQAPGEIPGLPGSPGATALHRHRDLLPRTGRHKTPGTSTSASLACRSTAVSPTVPARAMAHARCASNRRCCAGSIPSRG